MKPSRHTIRHFYGRLIARRLAAVVLTIGMTLSASAATYSYRFNATPLNEALSRIIADHPEVTVSFIFNELETYRTSAHVNADDPYTALRQLVAFNPIKIVSHRGVYFVEAMQHGRYCYTGRVEASDGDPVIAATVMALTPDDRTVITYGLTDSEGRFSIPCDRTSILLKISALGYRTDTITPTSFNLGNIRLATDAIALANVTVTARNISRVDDHLEIIPDKLSLKHASTGYQLLQNLMLPGISVDTWSGSVKLFGHDVNLYIDGEPADAKIIRNIRPRDVEKIEYHDVPSGRYAGKFAVINFITRQPRSGGYVTLDASQQIGYFNSDFNGFAKVSKDKLSFYTYLGYGNGYKDIYGNRTDEQFMFDSGTVGREVSGQSRSKSVPAYGQFRTVYRTDKTNLSGNLALVGSESESEDYGEIDYYSTEAISESTHTKSVNHSLSPSVALSGQFALPKNQYINAYLNGNYARNNRDYIYQAGNFGLTSLTKEDFYSFSSQLTYGKNLNHNNILNIYLVDAYFNTDAAYHSDSPSEQRLWSNELLLFAQYGQRLGSFNIFVRPGLTILSSRLDGMGTRVKYNPRFYMQANYRLAKDHLLTASGGVGNSFPSLSSMSAAEQPVDRYQVSRGNPMLKTTAMYSASLHYSGQFNKVNLAFYTDYSYSHNSTIYDYTIENDKLIRSFINGTRQSLSVNLAASWNIRNNFRLSFPLQYYFFDNSGQVKRLSNVPVAAIEGMFFWKDFSLSFWAKNQAAYLLNDMCYSRDPSTYGLNLSWSHRGWNIQCRATHPIGDRKHKSWIDIPNVYSMHRLAWNKKFVSFKISYTFDFGKKTERDSQAGDVNRTINSGILK